MSTLAWFFLGLLALVTVGLVVGAARLERRQQEWEWLHPPNEDEGGVFLMEEDDPDGENTR